MLTRRWVKHFASRQRLSQQNHATVGTSSLAFLHTFARLSDAEQRVAGDELHSLGTVAIAKLAS